MKFYKCKTLAAVFCQPRNMNSRVAEDLHQWNNIVEQLHYVFNDEAFLIHPTIRKVA